MYIRVTSRKNKNNSVVKYVQLAHNVRNPKTGNPQADVIYNFGRLDTLDAYSTANRRSLHRKDDRICSHVLLCWLALLLVRLAEVQTKQTWLTLRSDLEQMHMIEHESSDGKVFQRTELTKEQMSIFSATKLPEPLRILDISLRRGQKL